MVFFFFRWLACFYHKHTHTVVPVCVFFVFVLYNLYPKKKKNSRSFLGCVRCCCCCCFFFFLSCVCVRVLELCDTHSHTHYGLFVCFLVSFARTYQIVSYTSTKEKRKERKDRFLSTFRLFSFSPFFFFVCLVLSCLFFRGKFWSFFPFLSFPFRQWHMCDV